MTISGADLTNSPTNNNQKKMQNFKNTNWTWIKENTQNPLTTKYTCKNFT